MSQLDEPPMSPEEEDANWAPAEKVSFRFTLTRLLLAMAVAPLPLLLIQTDRQLAIACFVGSSLSLFALTLLIRAEMIPWWNLAATPVLLYAYFDRLLPFRQSFRGTSPLMLALVWWGGIYILMQIFLRYCWKPTAKTRCIWVLYSAVIPFAIFAARTIQLLNFSFIELQFLLPSEIVAGNLLRVACGMTLVFSLYWAGTDRGETLEERPDLGVRYELTMMAIPYLALFAYFRFAESFPASW